MTTTNSKLTELRLEIEALETELLNDIQERSDIAQALDNADARITDKRRVRLANIAALTALEEGKF